MCFSTSDVLIEILVIRGPQVRDDLCKRIAHPAAPWVAGLTKPDLSAAAPPCAQTSACPVVGGRRLIQPSHLTINLSPKRKALG
jgi:hypothetical protein